MKTTQIIVSMLFVVILALPANAAKKGKDKEEGGAPVSRKYGMAGCGLGSVVMGKHGGQISAATTNQTIFYNQFFALTFGTLNCEDEVTHSALSKIDNFVAVNKVALAGDIARGEGETLHSLSAMMDCGDSVRFATTMQHNFGRIYPNERVQTMDVTDTLVNVANENDLSCRLVSNIG